MNGANVSATSGDTPELPAPTLALALELMLASALTDRDEDEALSESDMGRLEFMR